MALKAGRVGVAPDQVDQRGELKNAGLTPEQSAKLNRALLTPISAPLEKELIGVDTANAEIQIKIGDGLELEGATSPYTLKSSSEITSGIVQASNTISLSAGAETALGDDWFPGLPAGAIPLNAMSNTPGILGYILYDGTQYIYRFRNVTNSASSNVTVYLSYIK